MKRFLFSFILSLLLFHLPAQNAEGRPERTPEQEASKQTEVLQRELNLTPEQSLQIYAINLKYAKERQQSNTRTDAIERMKRKNADYQKVLTKEQYEHLQNKQLEIRSKQASGQIQIRTTDRSVRSALTDTLRPVRINFQAR